MLNKLKYRFLSELNIIGIIIAVLCLVGVMGYLAFTSLNTVVITSESKDLPNQKIVLLKDVFSDISDAQSSVRSYALSREQSSLSPFYNSVKSIDAKIDRLKEMYEADELGTSQLDSLQLLIEQKYGIMNEMLKLQNDDKITESLKRISKTIEAETKIENDTVESSNILERIFGKPTPDKSNNHFDPSKVKTAIARTREEQLKNLSDIRTQELELNSKDKRVTDHIRIILAAMEQNETGNLTQQALVIEEQGRQTVLAIAWFSIVVAMLLFLVIYVILRYVRKNHEFNIVLDKARHEAENLALAKERFLANMSHEIRTPMNAISGFSALLMDKVTNRSDKMQLEIIHRSSEHLLDVVNNILDYSKLQSGKLKVEFTDFSPSTAIEDVLKMLRHAALDKGLKFNFKTSELPAYVNGDSLRLRQILINIIGNAIKFTDKGRIDFTVEHVSRNLKAELFFTVKDTGIGINPEDQERIFDIFEQGGRANMAKYGGTGLGLSITRDLIHLLGGNIEIESEEGIGTTMRFNLQFDSSQKVDSVESHNKASAISMFAGMRFLIVDDEKYNRALLVSILDKWNAVYEEANDGIEVLDILARSKFDAVLMDIRMHGMGGLEATKMIRKDTGLIDPNVPVIAISAATSEVEKAECRKAGINAFISKPFSEAKLREVLVSVLFVKDDLLVVPDVKSNGRRDNSSDMYSLDELNKMSDNDHIFISEMIKTYQSTAIDSLNEIRNGIINNDLIVISHFAHKLAAPTRHLHANKVYELLKYLENATPEDLESGKLKNVFGKLESLLIKIIEQLNKEIISLDQKTE